jgi:hypothetical protein
MLSLGRKLKDLPNIAAALQEGRIRWSKAHQIAAVAKPENEVMWLESALSMRARELERKIDQEYGVTRRKYHLIRVGRGYRTGPHRGRRGGVAMNHPMTLTAEGVGKRTRNGCGSDRAIEKRGRAGEQTEYEKFSNTHAPSGSRFHKQ